MGAHRARRGERTDAHPGEPDGTERRSPAPRRFARVGDVRGAGLYLGVELVRDRRSKTPDREAATSIVDMLLDRNVLVGIAGPYGNVIKIRPPLTFTREHADILVKALSDSLASLP